MSFTLLQVVGIEISPLRSQGLASVEMTVFVEFYLAILYRGLRLGSAESG